jgi:hypothetical protein
MGMTIFKLELDKEFLPEMKGVANLSPVNYTLGV